MWLQCFRAEPKAKKQHSTPPHAHCEQSLGTLSLSEILAKKDHDTCLISGLSDW